MIDRLTERNKYGVAVMRLDIQSGMQGPVSRLAEYEDTDMTPEEIVALKTERDAAVRDLEWMMKVSRKSCDMVCSACERFHNCQRSEAKVCTPKWRGSDGPESIYTADLVQPGEGVPLANAG